MQNFIKIHVEDLLKRHVGMQADRNVNTFFLRMKFGAILMRNE
jgi:hypothetical protein